MKKPTSILFAILCYLLMILIMSACSLQKTVTVSSSDRQSILFTTGKNPDKIDIPLPDPVERR